MTARTRRTAAGGAATALAILLCGIAAAGEEPGFTLELSGPIDDAMLERFQSALDAGNLARVVITSNGSAARENRRRGTAALQMAELIRARGIDLVVKGICAESCANYVFVAARHRHVEPDSLVMFAPSVTGMMRVREILGEDYIPTDFQPLFRTMADLAEAERDLFEQRGVRLSLLKDSSDARQPHCVTFYRNQSRPVSFSVQMNYAWWVPTREQLAASGIKVLGFWPASRKRTHRLADKFMSSGSSRLVRFGDDDHIRKRKQAPYQPTDLRKCVLEEVTEQPASADDAAPAG